MRRRELLEPLINGKVQGRASIEAYAKEKGIGYVSLYR